jgi:hypothetical protein
MKMKSKRFYFVVGGALLLGAFALSAQEPPPGPLPSPDVLMPGAVIGPRMEILGFGEVHPGKVVTGAPYSAVAVTDTMQTLADGNVVNRKIQSNVYRDSQGRTRKETAWPATFSRVGPFGGSDQPISMVTIHDPVTSTAYILNIDEKVAERLPTPSVGPESTGQLMAAKMQAHFQKEIANGTLKKEDLGVQTINGISAQGTRYTRTIPAGHIGNTKDMTIIDEQWYSPDLQVVVKSVRSDPRFGLTTYNLTNIQRTVPAASLFTVPSDYTVRKGGLRGAQVMGGPGAEPATVPEPNLPPTK